MEEKKRKPGFTYIWSETLKQEIAMNDKTGKVYCEDGTVYGGCNVEGSSYGNTICAERTALVKAVSEGKRDFVKLAVCASTDDICTPCGICRQMLADFSLNMIILCANQNGDYVEKKLSDLLPMAFTGESLK